MGFHLLEICYDLVVQALHSIARGVPLYRCPVSRTPPGPLKNGDVFSFYLIQRGIPQMCLHVCVYVLCRFIAFFMVWQRFSTLLNLYWDKFVHCCAFARHPSRTGSSRNTHIGCPLAIQMSLKQWAILVEKGQVCLGKPLNCWYFEKKWSWKNVPEISQLPFRSLEN